MLPVPFEINDHKYVCTPHPAREGMGFAKRVVGAAVAPLLRVLDAAFRDGSVKPGASFADPEVLSALLDKMDLSGVAADMRAAIEALSEDEIVALFKYTTRDGQKLSNSAVFDSAYAGNWAEFYQAVAHVVRVNKFLPF
jgi:hypothetical protein